MAMVRRRYIVSLRGGAAWGGRFVTTTNRFALCFLRTSVFVLSALPPMALFYFGPQSFGPNSAGAGYGTLVRAQANQGRTRGWCTILGVPG